MYHQDTLLVDYMAADPTFYEWSAIADYFGNCGVPAPVSTVPTSIKIDSTDSNTIHEVGLLTFVQDGEKVSANYYMRWVNRGSATNLDDWKISLDVVPIGTPAEISLALDSGLKLDGMTELFVQ